MERRVWTAVLLGWLLVLGSCSSGRADDFETGGEGAVEYFETWVNVLSTNDAYGVLDFHTSDAIFEDRTGVFGEVTLPVRNTLRGNRSQIARRLLEVHVGFQQAVVVLFWPDKGEYGASLVDMEDGLISRETVFLDAASLGRSLRASPEVVAYYEQLYQGFAAAWSGGERQKIAQLYGPNAVVRDALLGDVVPGGDPNAPWRELLVAELGPGTDGRSAGLPVFIDPVGFGADSQRAIGVFDVQEPGGCVFRTAIHWRMSGGLIVAEDRFRVVGPAQQCEPSEPFEGWWTGLDLPGPRDQLETGTVITPSGEMVSIRNGSPTLERLVRFGFDQFALAGLPEPVVDSVTFEPSRTCEGVSGRLLDNRDSRDLVLCFYEDDVCPNPDRCAVMNLSARIGMLHELGHAWLLDEFEVGSRSDLLAISGRSEWDSPEVPWGDRGVEYAAQILAWGISGQDLPLIELGQPSCEEAVAAYQLLTDMSPITQAAGCSLSS